ncbi:MAG: HK97 family phage prohead protease [Hyphomonas sp.]
MRELKFYHAGVDTFGARQVARQVKASGPLLIEGYASLFGQTDAGGDVVRAGAFARSLNLSRDLPMLLQHRNGAVAGRWTRAVEDGRGLFVRGLIESEGARTLTAQGLNGLSIGFRAVDWRPNAAGGRDLNRVELVEVSLVSSPMLNTARFKVLGGVRDTSSLQYV